MDGFFEKFSIYDFFNLLGSGAIFLLGLLGLKIIDLTSLITFIDVFGEMQWLAIVSILIISYLVGTILQQIGNLTFEKRYSRYIISYILCPCQSVLENPIKIEIHQTNANKLFDQKGILHSGDCYTSSQSEYYFAHCSYYIQNQSKHHKSEKMRGLRGIYSLLIVCCSGLLLISSIRLIWAIVNAKSILYWGISSVVLCLLIFLYCHAYKESTRFWVKMVLGVYEACADTDT